MESKYNGEGSYPQSSSIFGSKQLVEKEKKVRSKMTPDIVIHNQKSSIVDFDYSDKYVL